MAIRFVKASGGGAKSPDQPKKLQRLRRALRAHISHVRNSRMVLTRGHR